MIYQFDFFLNRFLDALQTAVQNTFSARSYCVRHTSTPPRDPTEN